MTDKEVIARLTKENMELKDFLEEARKDASFIVCSIVCIGGPLNDNVKGYTSNQMKDFWDIKNLAENIISNANNLVPKNYD